MPDEIIEQQIIESPNLEASIQAAVDEQTAASAAAETAVEEKGEVQTGEVPEPVAEEKAEEVKQPDNTAQALQIYEALMNPATREAAVEFLAKQAGLSLTKAAPVQNQEKEQTIAELVQQELGQDYEFLSPKLGTAIERVINKVIGPIQEQMQRTQVVSEMDRVIDRINTETKGEFKQLEKEVAQVMQRLRPADGVSAEDFLWDAFTLVKAGKPADKAPVQRARQEVAQRIQQRASEIIPSPSTATENKVVQGPAQYTLDDAIAAALRGEKWQ